MVIYHEYKKTTPLLFLQIHFSKMKTLSMCNFNILRHYQATTVKLSGAFCTGTAEQEVDPHILLEPVCCKKRQKYFLTSNWFVE